MEHQEKEGGTKRYERRVKEDEKHEMPPKTAVIDNPCWGSPECCSLKDLLKRVDRTKTVLLESDDYLAIHKPPDLRMDGDYPATVLKLLMHWYAGKSVVVPKSPSKFSDNPLRPCHQLDYATSGVLLFGKSQRAAGKACEAFRNRTTQKQYLAIVNGHVDAAQTSISVLRGWTSQSLHHHLVQHEQKGTRKKQQRRKDTFEGFQPPHSMFLKWKGRFRRRETNKKTRGRNPDFPHVWMRLDNALSNDDEEKLVGMKWNQVRNSRWEQLFVDLSTRYNEALKDTITTKPHDQPSLPTVFRLDGENEENVVYIYAALAPQPDSFAMKIHPHATAAAKDVEAGPNDGLVYKEGLTRCTVLHRGRLSNNQPVTKVRLEPLTGRRHQLRCHMALLGNAILGDATYSKGTGKTRNNDNVSRMCLHAHQLCIPSQHLNVVAPDPFPVHTDGTVNVSDDYSAAPHE